MSWHQHHESTFSVRIQLRARRVWTKQPFNESTTCLAYIFITLNILLCHIWFIALLKLLRRTCHMKRFFHAPVQTVSLSVLREQRQEVEVPGWRMSHSQVPPTGNACPPCEGLRWWKDVFCSWSFACSTGTICRWDEETPGGCQGGVRGYNPGTLETSGRPELIILRRRTKKINVY